MSSSLLWGVHYLLENINNARNQQKKKLEMKITGTPARTCEGSQSGSGTHRTPCLTRSSQGPHGPPAFLLIKAPFRKPSSTPTVLQATPTHSVDDPAVTAHWKPAASIIEQQGLHCEQTHADAHMHAHTRSTRQTHWTCAPWTRPPAPTLHPCGYTCTPVK